jgi:hypothetical protein
VSRPRTHHQVKKIEGDVSSPIETIYEAENRVQRTIWRGASSGRARRGGGSRRFRKRAKIVNFDRFVAIFELANRVRRPGAEKKIANKPNSCNRHNLDNDND